MTNTLEPKESSKKRKLSEKSKLFVEFKGLNSLNDECKNAAKVAKFESNVKSSELVEKVVRPQRNTNILLENIDCSVTKKSLERYLVENGVNCSKISLVTGPLAVAYFNREKDVDRLFNICQGLCYKSNELFIAKSSMKHVSTECNATNTSDISVHIKNLESTTTQEEISALLSDTTVVQNISINSEKGTAIIDFVDSKSAHECITKLDNYKFGEKYLKASFLVKSQRPEQYSLKVTNLPNGFNKIDIRQSFPTASKIKVLKGNNRYCMIYFKTADDFEAVLLNKETFYVKGSPVNVTEMIKSKKKEIKDNFVLNIYNMPFDTTLQEIRDQYPLVRYIEMLKNSDGMFVGSAKLNFAEKELCEEALKNTKGLTLKHRKIRAEMKVENSGLKESVESQQHGVMDLDE